MSREACRRGLAVAAAAVVALLAAAPAFARPAAMSFAAGEQWIGWPSGSFDHTDADYYTQRRDLSAYTPAVWRALARTHTPIAVHLRYGRDFGPVPAGMPRLDDALPILRGAARHRVPVIAWIVVPYRDGYWAHERNADVHADALRAFADWRREQPFDLDTVLIDLESSLQDTRVLGKVKSEPEPALQTFRRNVGPAEQCAAARAYARVVRNARAEGLDVTAAAYPFFLDDLENGDIALSDGLNMPVFTPGLYDAVGFMTMRSVYFALTGEDPGPSLQASYARSVERWFPAEGELVLGVAGAAPYDELGEVVRDVRTAAAVSDRTVNMYSLESTVNAFGAAGLRRILRAARRPLTGRALEEATAESAGTRLARALIAAEDVGVAAGSVPALLSRGEAPALPNASPQACSAAP